MLTFGSKTFAGAALVSAVGAVVYAANTTDGAGVVLLMVAILASALLAFSIVVGAGPSDQYSYPEHADPRPARDPLPSIVPFGTALGAGAIVLALAYGAAGYVIGGLVIAFALVIWFAQAWRYNHPDYTRALTTRVSDGVGLPFGMPLLLLGLIAVLGVALSRTLLAVSPTASWVIALVIAACIFLGAMVLANRSRMSRGVVIALIVLAAIVIAGLGIYGLARGERSTEEHEEAIALVRS